MTRIFCKPLSFARGSAGLIVLQLALGLLTLSQVTPAEAASRSPRASGASRLSVALPNRPLPLIHDAAVSILSAPPALWQRPAGDPTALNPVAARCHQATSSGWQDTPFTALRSNGALSASRSVSVDALTTTFYVSESPAGEEWTAETEPLTTLFSRH